jgi:hypothetical protein
MPFDLDVTGSDFRLDPYFHRPAMRIEITTFDGEHIQTITLPEITIPISECARAWRDMEPT